MTRLLKCWRVLVSNTQSRIKYVAVLQTQVNPTVKLCLLPSLNWNWISGSNFVKSFDVYGENMGDGKGGQLEQPDDEDDDEDEDSSDNSEDENTEQLLQINIGDILDVENLDGYKLPYR